MATITLCMIARDEEKYISGAIGSVRDVVDEIIVVDTGSRDKTPEIARELGAKVLHFKWNDDFSEARNFSLAGATSDWIFVLDADEEILREDASKLRQLADSGSDACLFVQKNFSNDAHFSGFFREPFRGFKGFYPSFIIRLFRNDSRIRFSGFVHETVDASLNKINARVGISSIPIYHFQELKGANAFRDKQLKYAELLEKNMGLFPDKARAYHDIGIVNYRFRSDYKKAIESFNKSLSINSKNTRVLNDLGAAYVQVGDYRRALDAFGKSLDVNPEPSTFYSIGILQEKLGNYEAAILSYSEAARLNHPNKPAILDKIRLLKSLENERKK
ncbi:glycosyltransferase [Candidatus Woesearchaeota archaeon]|nr:glycosyltransferase [Candidatus Woesearchaeota archaeon]